MNRTPPLIAAVVVGALLTASCAGGDDDTDAADESTTTAAPTTTTTDPPATSAPTTSSTTTIVDDVLRMPLTGEPVESESDIPDRPALVVKISNAPPSVLPQAGLNLADLVIEEVINDRATRLAAVFHTNDADPVGPIRSGRNQDINLLLALNRPLFAWSGGNPAVTRAIRESDLIDLSAVSNPGYYRRSGRSSPNNLYSSTDALWAQETDEAGRPPQLFEYLDVDEEPTGDEATTIEVVLDNVDVRWEYDPETGRYYRWQDGAEHATETVDSESGVERVWVDNVVVMMADYGVNPADGNPEGQVLGSNPVYIFTGGTVREGVWLRFDATDPLGFFDDAEALDPLGLQPGRTWLEIPRNLDDVLTWSPDGPDGTADADEEDDTDEDADEDADEDTE